DLLVAVARRGRVRAREHAGEEQVVGLEVAMDDPLRVRLRERAERLPHRIDGDGDRETTDPRETLPEALALEQLHREIELAALALAEVEDRDGVRRREQAVRPRLAHEASLRGLVDRAIAAEDLDGDLAAHR